MACRIEQREVGGPNRDQATLWYTEAADPRLLWQRARSAEVATRERRPTRARDPDAVWRHREHLPVRHRPGQPQWANPEEPPRDRAQHAKQATGSAQPGSPAATAFKTLAIGGSVRTTSHHRPAFSTSMLSVQSTGQETATSDCAVCVITSPAYRLQLTDASA